MRNTKRKLAHADTSARSITKTITYRIVITIAVFIVSYLTTGDIVVTATITGVTAITSTIIYYAHERIWSLISWGRK